MSSRKLLGQANLFLATGLGIGHFSRMPGTLGSLWGPLVVWGLQSATSSPLEYWIAVSLVWFIGIFVCGAASRLLNIDDPGQIVYDEIAAFPIVFALTPLTWGSAVLGYLWFRLFDITKPWPVSRFDRLHGGLGIMADDAVAAVFAGGALWGSWWLLSYWS